MPRHRFSELTLDPASLRVLYDAFDSIWKQVEPGTSPWDFDRVRDVIAVALISMAQCGQLDPDRLQAYALDQAIASLKARTRL